MLFAISAAGVSSCSTRSRSNASSYFFSAISDEAAANRARRDAGDWRRNRQGGGERLLVLCGVRVRTPQCEPCLVVTRRAAPAPFRETPPAPPEYRPADPSRSSRTRPETARRGAPARRRAAPARMSAGARPARTRQRDRRATRAPRPHPAIGRCRGAGCARGSISVLSSARIDPMMTAEAPTS